MNRQEIMKRLFTAVGTRSNALRRTTIQAASTSTTTLFTLTADIKHCTLSPLYLFKSKPYKNNTTDTVGRQIHYNSSY